MNSRNKKEPKRKRPRSNNENTITTSTSKTNQRLQNQHTIQGVSPTVTPFLLDAVKRQRNLLKQCDNHKMTLKQLTTSITNSNSRSLTSNQNDSTCTPHDTKDILLSRIQQQENNIVNHSIQEAYHSSQESIQSLLTCLKQETATTSTTITTNTTLSSQSHPNHKDNSTISSLVFLFDIVMDHAANPILRRAAQSIAGILMCNIYDAWLFIHNGAFAVLSFLDAVGTTVSYDSFKSMSGKQSSQQGESASRQYFHSIRLLQQETIELLQDITTSPPPPPRPSSSSLQSTRINPQLHVGIRYLQEQKGITPHNDDSQELATIDEGNLGMLQLRTLRDEAIQHGERVVVRVHKIIKCVDSCFEVLVPRFGGSSRSVHHSVNHENIVGSKNNIDDNDEHNPNKVADDDDDDDDDIDWEDGDDTLTPTQHLQAVEQTIAVMQQSKTLYSGALNISLDNHHHDEEPTQTIMNTTIQKHQRTLDKFIPKLSNHYYPLLSKWIHALSHSDAMMIPQLGSSSTNGNTTTTSSSLILLPLEIRTLKQEILIKLQNLLLEVQNVLRSANRYNSMNLNGSNVSTTTTTAATTWLQSVLGIHSTATQHTPKEDDDQEDIVRSVKHQRNSRNNVRSNTNHRRIQKVKIKLLSR